MNFGALEYKWKLDHPEVRELLAGGPTEAERIKRLY